MLLNALIKKGTLLNKSIQKHSEALRSIQRFDVFLMHKSWCGTISCGARGLGRPLNGDFGGENARGSSPSNLAL
jgi:hypothetical protein